MRKKAAWFTEGANLTMLAAPRLGSWPSPNTVQLLTTTLLTAFAETPVSFACATVTPCRVTCEVPSRVTASMKSLTLSAWTY